MTDLLGLPLPVQIVLGVALWILGAALTVRAWRLFDQSDYLPVDAALLVWPVHALFGIIMLVFCSLNRVTKAIAGTE